MISNEDYTLTQILSQIAYSLTGMIALCGPTQKIPRVMKVEQIESQKNREESVSTDEGWGDFKMRQ